ncbi:aminotransferase class IV [Streptomyces coeruleoprunus]|uniref:Aminotransferase class IV n=1 Tax=Streptomyces coeruleoprunus TaxID=285563 RepID=A0ABV9X529_9ACTN
MDELNGQPADAGAVRALALANYGHFTTFRVDDGRVRGLALHLERLERDCRAVFGADLDTARVRAYVRHALRERGGDSPLVRVSVFDPGLDIGRPASAGEPHVLVTTRPGAPAGLPPLRVGTVPYVRDLAAVKHVGLFGALHARRRAQLDGYDDALFHGPDGRVTEGPTWNAGFVDGEGRVVLPEGDVLPGVTLELIRRQYACVARPVTVAEARGMRAGFATSTGIGVRALASVDGRPLATDDPVLGALRETYERVPGDPL